ncbi:MAG: LTA synthase family protein, partial [Burkholderiales bacterium]
LAERAKSSLPRASPFSGAASAGRDSPHIVAVQSESFLDARRLFAGIRPEVLREYDALRAAAACHGRVEVSAWGANTVRTEFAFLSGLGAGALGIHRFNPYRRLARQGVPTLPGFLKRAGYRAVCVHPYPASFYTRDEVYPLLGFDEFIDIRGFDGAERAGSYVCDVAVAEKVCGLLGGASSRPLFVFVITMENHGPLHLEKALPADVERLYSVAPPAGCDDLTTYLRHLGNADRMAGMLRDRLESLPGSSWLCWFGDHVPIMPKVYETMGYADGRTDYFIWGKGRTPHATAKLDLKVEDLGVLLLERAGLLIEPPMYADERR